MSEGKRFRFEFEGDFVECHIAPLPADKANAWLGRSEEDLFRHAFGLDGDEADETDETWFGRATDLPGARHLEGCELRHGSLDIRDSNGKMVASHSLEDEEFQDGFIDQTDQIDPDSYLQDGGPTLIVRTTYSGTATYEPETEVGAFEDAGWYVTVTDMGGEPFISSLNFENEDVDPGGTGRFGLQEVWLNVPTEDGKIQQVYHSADPAD